MSICPTRHRAERNRRQGNVDELFTLALHKDRLRVAPGPWDDSSRATSVHLDEEDLLLSGENLCGGNNKATASILQLKPETQHVDEIDPEPGGDILGVRSTALPHGVPPASSTIFTGSAHAEKTRLETD
jgi:hypothetical protein